MKRKYNQNKLNKASKILYWSPKYLKFNWIIRKKDTNSEIGKLEEINDLFTKYNCENKKIIKSLFECHITSLYIRCTDERITICFNALKLLFADKLVNINWEFLPKKNCLILPSASW